MFEIKITDPHLMPEDVLRKTSEYLLSFIKASLPVDVSVIPTTVPITVSPISQSIKDIEDFIPNVPQRTLETKEVELDAKKLPWDGRIHASSKLKNADGFWKLKRSVNPELVRNVQEELHKAKLIPSVTVIQEEVLPSDSLPQNDFPALMMKITKAVHAGKITSEAVNKLIQDMGLPSLPIVATRPDLIPSIMIRLDLLISEGSSNE